MAKGLKKGRKTLRNTTKGKIYQELSSLQPVSRDRLASKIGGLGKNQYAHEARMLDKAAANAVQNGQYGEALMVYQEAAGAWSQAAEEAHGNKQYLNNEASDLMHAGDSAMIRAPMHYSSQNARAERDEAVELEEKAGQIFESLSEHNRAGESFEKAGHDGEWTRAGTSWTTLPIFEGRNVVNDLESAAEEFAAAGHHNRAAQDYGEAADHSNSFQVSAELYVDAAKQEVLAGHSQQAGEFREEAAQQYNDSANNLNQKGNYAEAAQEYMLAGHNFEMSGLAGSNFDAGSAYNNAAQNFILTGSNSEAMQAFHLSTKYYVDSLARNPAEVDGGNAALTQAMDVYNSAKFHFNGSEEFNEYREQFKSELETAAWGIYNEKHYFLASQAFESLVSLSDSATQRAHYWKASGNSLLDLGTNCSEQELKWAMQDFIYAAHDYPAGEGDRFNMWQQVNNSFSVLASEYSAKGDSSLAQVATDFAKQAAKYAND